MSQPPAHPSPDSPQSPPPAPLRILVSATQAEPTRLTRQLTQTFGVDRVTQWQTVRLQATGDCAGLAAALLKPFTDTAAGSGTRMLTPAWVVLTSPGGIGVVWQELRARGLTQPILQLLRYAVVGDATADALRAEGLEPAYISGHGHSASADAARANAADTTNDSSVTRAASIASAASAASAAQSTATPTGGARALAEGLAASGLTTGAAVHVLQSNRADSSVWTPLQAKAATLKRWVAYRSDLMPEDTGPVAAAFRAGEFTAAGFTSGSTVEGLYAVLGSDKADATTRLLEQMQVFSIGPTATRALQQAGVRQVIDAPDATVAALAECMRKNLA